MIQKDDTILMIDNRNDQRLIKISDNRKFKWRKIPIDLNQLLKYPYNSCFQIVNGQLKLSQPLQIDSQPEEQPQVKADNRQIFTQKHAQKLQHQQIQALKQTTTDAKQLISKIVQNNEQFEKRTQYSKEKYLKRKKAKYIFAFAVYKANIENVAEFYFLSEPKASAYLRWDMLGLLLQEAGIGERVLIADRTKGLVTGAMVLRGCGQVTVINEDEKRHPTKQLIYQNMNIPKQSNSRVRGKTLQQLVNSPQTYTNLCIAGDLDSSQLITSLVNKLESGSFITVYSCYLQPLGKAFDTMLDLRKFINIKMNDTFTRRYQVLKNRTHPMMSMHGFGGYLLTAIKVDEAK